MSCLWHYRVVEGLLLFWKQINRGEQLKIAASVRNKGMDNAFISPSSRVVDHVYFVIHVEVHDFTIY
jgi:hypothetical protein